VLGVFGEGFDRIKVKAKNKTEKSTSNPSWNKADCAIYL
jgi:hypothetical protein